MRYDYNGNDRWKETFFNDFSIHFTEEDLLTNIKQDYVKAKEGKYFKLQCAFAASKGLDVEYVLRKLAEEGYVAAILSGKKCIYHLIEIIIV